MQYWKRVCLCELMTLTKWPNSCMAVVKPHAVYSSYVRAQSPQPISTTNGVEETILSNYVEEEVWACGLK